jgi:hypothetical protein
MRLAEKTGSRHQDIIHMNNNNSLNSTNHKSSNTSELCTTAGGLTRRKLETEDSSYGSDQEGLGVSSSSGPFNKGPLSAARSHEDVSRSDSETLGQEFAEYVTVRGKLASRDSSPSAGLAERLEAVGQEKAAAAAALSATTPQSQAQQRLSVSSLNTATTTGDIDITKITQDPSYNSKVPSSWYRYRGIVFLFSIALIGLAILVRGTGTGN